MCGSDIHVYHGVHPYTGYPVMQGREVSGVFAISNLVVQVAQASEAEKVLIWVRLTKLNLPVLFFLQLQPPSPILHDGPVALD